MSLDFNITSEREGCKKISLVGNLDSSTAPQLQEAIGESIGDDDSTVILDCKQLEFLSSAGLRICFKLKKDLSSRGGKLLYVYMQPQVRKVFEIVSAVDSSQVFASLEELDEYLLAIQKEIIDGKRSDS